MTFFFFFAHSICSLAIFFFLVQEGNTLCASTLFSVVVIRFTVIFFLSTFKLEVRQCFTLLRPRWQLIKMNVIFEKSVQEKDRQFGCENHLLRSIRLNDVERRFTRLRAVLISRITEFYQNRLPSAFVLIFVITQKKKYSRKVRKNNRNYICHCARKSNLNLSWVFFFVFLFCFSALFITLK